MEHQHNASHVRGGRPRVEQRDIGILTQIILSPLIWDLRSRLETAVTERNHSQEVDVFAGRRRLRSRLDRVQWRSMP
jgi:hypothetical protein